MSSKTPPKKVRVSLHTRFVAIVSIALPLFILSWIGILEAMRTGLEKQVREDVTFTLVLSREMGGKAIEKLTKSLEKEDCIKSVRYISPDDAAKELTEELGENPVKLLGYNPFYPSLEFNLNAQYTHRDSLPKVDSLIRSLNGVDNFTYRGEQLDNLDIGVKRISMILLGVIILMLLIAIVQINNTTHLAIYSRRFLIRSMTLLGARYSLICRPFLRYSIFNGLWGGLLANLLLAASLWGIYYYTGNVIVRHLTTPSLLLIGIGLPLLGMLLSLITALFSTRRYIRMDGSRIVLS